MKPRLSASTLIGLMFTASSGLALASEDCPRAPLEQWKPESEARAATEALGYRVTRVAASDGCYEVRASDKRGRPVEVKFNPTDMKMVSRLFVQREELAVR